LNYSNISCLFAVISSYRFVMLCEKAPMTTQTPIPTPVPAVREHFAKRLKELRIPRGFPTARSLSRALGIDENRYTRYERAEVEPDLSLLLKICGLLRASPNDLLIPTGFDEAQRSFAVEPTPEPANFRSNGAKPSPAVAADPMRRRAIAWQLASELVGCGAIAPNPAATTEPLARLQQIKTLFSEIEADAFGTIGTVLDHGRLETVATTDAAKISALVEELIATIAADAPGLKQL
jgi:transcriptional regulator with XRE-family HTH domain